MRDVSWEDIFKFGVSATAGKFYDGVQIGIDVLCPSSCLKQKSLSLLINLAVGTFDELLIVFSTKVNLLYFRFSTVQICCLFASDKAKLFAQNFSKNSNIDDSGSSLLVFPSRTNLKQHNISVTRKFM